MKNLFLAFFLFSCGVLAQSVTIDPKTTTNGSAIIKAQSTTAGTLIPNMTSSQRTLIAVPPKGLLVFDTDTGTFWFHNGTDWVQLVGGTSYWTPTNGASNLFSSYPTFTLGGGTNTAGLLSGAGSDGTLRVFSPGSITANRYLNLDGISIQARRANDLTGVKTENNLLLNPFGGNIGIGLTSPNAPLQFASTSNINRKIVLFEDFNNNHQFYGFGINDGLLRYQSSGGGDHVFYSAISASASKELMRIKYDGNVKLSEGMYSNQTGNLNMVPLGVVQYWVQTNGGYVTTSNYRNIAGNLVTSHTHWAEANIITSSGMGIELRLNPSIVSQYSRIIAVGSPGFIGYADAESTNSIMSGISMHFNPNRMVNFSIPEPDERNPPTNYEKFTVEMIVDDWAIIRKQTLHGTVMFYGIK